MVLQKRKRRTVRVGEQGRTRAQMEEESLRRNVAYGTAERAKWMDTDASHLRKPHVMP